MSAADYFTAAIPEPIQILGLRLKPFCLGHYFLMRRFGVAFASDDGANAEFDDLIFGVLICSMSYESFFEFMENDPRLQISEWAAKLGLDVTIPGFGIELPEKVKLFNEYLAKAYVQPVVIYESDNSNSGAHWSQVLKCSLISQCGYNTSEAMNLPLPQAFADFYKNAENNGVLTIADDLTAKLLKESEAA